MSCTFPRNVLACTIVSAFGSATAVAAPRTPRISVTENRSTTTTAAAAVAVDAKNAKNNAGEKRAAGGWGSANWGGGPSRSRSTPGLGLPIPSGSERNAHLSRPRGHSGRIVALSPVV